MGRLSFALELEPQVFCILELLITRHGEIVSRDEIIDEVWDGRQMSNNVIDNRIRAARAAIGDTGKRQRYIKTYPNLGYKFTGNVRPVEDVRQAAAAITSKPQSETLSASEEHRSRKGLFFLQNSTALKLAAMAVMGVLGFYALSQTVMSGGNQAPPLNEASDEAAIFRSALSDDLDALPRVAVLPFETTGDSADHGFIPQIFQSEFSHTITAIDGITVVALSSGAKIENDLKNDKSFKEAIGLDYAIASNLTPYGEDYKLNVSLIRVADRAVLYDQIYDLNVSSGLKDLPAVIASKVALMTANKLNLSVQTLPPSWGNYEFYAKYERSKKIAAPLRYESVKKAAELLREVIKEEPNYIPAYSELLGFLSYQVIFYLDGYMNLYKEQIELAQKMNEVAPEAPETLIMNAFMNGSEGGVIKSSMGEYVPNDPVSVAKYIIKDDPDNLVGHSTLAMYSFTNMSPSESIKAIENALSVMPTEDWLLSRYSWSLLCDEQLDKARATLDTTSKWYPDRNGVLVFAVKQAHALGDYKTALIKSKKLLGQGYINANDAYALSHVFFDLGYPELALPHIRFQPMKAHVYAMMGEKESALKEASVIEKYYASVNARLIVEEDYVPENYAGDRAYKYVGKPNDKTKAISCRLDELMRDTYVLKKMQSERFESFYPLLKKYFEDKDVKSHR